MTIGPYRHQNCRPSELGTMQSRGAMRIASFSIAPGHSPTRAGKGMFRRFECLHQVQHFELSGRRSGALSLGARGAITLTALFATRLLTNKASELLTRSGFLF